MKTTSNIDVTNIQVQSEEVVERFLTALVEQDHNVITELLHSDAYILRCKISNQNV